MIVVSDTSPVTALLQVDYGSLLPTLFGEVLIPPAVQAELLRYHGTLPGYLQVRAIQNERGAEALCEETGSWLPYWNVRRTLCMAS